MMSSLLTKDSSVEKCSAINDSVLLTSNSSVPTTCNTYMLTRTRNSFVSSLELVQQSDPPSYWYNIY